MSKKKKTSNPKLQSLLICDEIIRDERTQKTSLINCFTNINTNGFPFQHSRLIVFISVTDGRGKTEARLRLVKGDDLSGKPLFEAKGPLVFPNPLAVVNLVFDIHKLVFPEPGAYFFELHVNDEHVGAAKFTVSLADARS